MAAGDNHQTSPHREAGAESGSGRFDAETALVVVDVQNDFVDPAGGLYVRGGEEVVAPINHLVDEASQFGAGVFYTQDWHPARTPHFVTDGGVWPVHCVADTWGAELHPKLRVVGDVVRKGVQGEDGYSGFSVRDPSSGGVHGTALDSLLKARGARSVVIVGVAGDVCVKATALDAIALGFRTEVVRSAVRSVELQPGDEDRAYEELAAAGVNVTD